MVQVARPLSKPARLALCDRSSLPGAVDGAWWPRSPNLRSELPDLVAVIGLSIGQVRRVVYDPSMWPNPPSRIIRGSIITSVDPYALVARDTIYLMGTHSRDAVLYVVPPTVPGAVVRRVLGAVSSQTPSMCVSVLRQLVKHFAAEARRPQTQ
jgi:hypothetical protein